MLAPTPPERLVDSQGRPYFLWDMEMTLAEFERALHSPERPYFVGKLMRQAKPDDVLQFMTPQEIAELLPDVDRYLGRSRAFWKWLIERWESRGLVRR
jgi:hypothetical protein